MNIMKEKYYLRPAVWSSLYPPYRPRAHVFGSSMSRVQHFDMIFFSLSLSLQLLPRCIRRRPITIASARVRLVEVLPRAGEFQGSVAGRPVRIGTCHLCGIFAVSQLSAIAQCRGKLAHCASSRAMCVPRWSRADGEP